MAEFQRRRNKNFPEKSIENEVPAVPPYQNNSDKLGTARPPKPVFQRRRVPLPGPVSTPSLFSGGASPAPFAP
jgi:hypothetical protein